MLPKGLLQVFLLCTIGVRIWAGHWRVGGTDLVNGGIEVLTQVDVLQELLRAWACRMTWCRRKPAKRRLGLIRRRWLSCQLMRPVALAAMRCSSFSASGHMWRAGAPFKRPGGGGVRGACVWRGGDGASEQPARRRGCQAGGLAGTGLSCSIHVHEQGVGMTHYLAGVGSGRQCMPHLLDSK